MGVWGWNHSSSDLVPSSVDLHTSHPPPSWTPAGTLTGQLHAGNINIDFKKDVMKTWKFLSISQLVSKSSSSSPKGFISCSATFRTKCKMKIHSAQCWVTKGSCEHISDLKPPSIKEELQ